MTYIFASQEGIQEKNFLPEKGYFLAIQANFKLVESCKHRWGRVQTLAEGSGRLEGFLATSSM